MTNAVQAYSYSGPSALVGYRLGLSTSGGRTATGGVYDVETGTGSCTCPWWFDHPGSRGPCKHVLAARIATRSTPATVGVTDGARDAAAEEAAL
ncbi:SWIM zinc finger family protein [Sphaerisporangium dianthi]|uniref:SWIM zinc finger family protein n=1 Tax=Sphaerisporangium dianthi TaxID=1436120 RepID=A0ABV9CSA7_9ACTN